MANKKLKTIMTNFAAGHITKAEKDKAIKGLKVAEDKPESQIEGKEELAPINSKKGKKQRDEKREKLVKKAEEDHTQIKSEEVK